MKKIKSRRKRIKRKKRLTFLATLPLIIFIALISTSVKAGTQDATLTRTKIEGIYSVAPLSDRTHLYNLEIYNVNNKIAYCIEINKKINTDIYNSTIDINEQINITNLSKEQLNYIKMIINFSYGYQNHSDYKYYMAAQELIWEYINKVDITWTNVLDINGEKINIDTYKNEIMSLVNSYKQEPNIDNNINCQLGDQLIITDSTNSLKHYNILSAGNQSAKIENNKLIIDISTDYIGTTEIKLQRKNYYNHSSFLFYADNTQQILSVGNTEEKIKTIKLNIEGATLTTNLLDMETRDPYPQGEATLEGAVYELYNKDNELLETFTTDSLGINKIKNLYHGKYYIKQIKASKGYLLNNNIVNFEINSNTKKVNLTQKVIKSQVEINKLYEVDNNYINEPNVIFNIYTSYNSIYTSFYTSKNSSKKISLPYGTYIIKQMTTTYGYNKIQDITIKIDENTEPTITYNLKNDKLKTKLNIITKDKTTNEKISESNIKYQIKNIKTNEYITYKDDSGNNIDVFSTNESGQVQPQLELPYGEYQLEQIFPPKKYLENKEFITFIINEKTQYTNYNNELVLNIEFFNTLIIGKLNITTKEEKFITEENYYKTEIFTRGNIKLDLYYEDEFINTYKTNNEGLIEINNLKLGNYCLKEKNTEIKECFELINYDNKTKVVEKDIEIIKKLPTTNVILNNIDNKKEPIEGTVIELYHQNQLINTSKTNEEGIIKVPKLPAGKYCFKQKEIPLKYIIDSEETCFEINDTSKDLNITIINNIQETKIIEVPNTLSNKKNHLILMPAILIIGVIIYKKKNIVNNN